MKNKLWDGYSPRLKGRGASAILGVLLLAGLAGWFWLMRSSQAESNIIVSPSRCSIALAIALAERDGLTALTCTSDEFITNTQEALTVVEIIYGTDKGCKTQCFRGGRIYFVKDSDQILRTVEHRFSDPDLSLGSDNIACKYIWTNDLRAMIQADPEHIKRLLIKENDEYRWQLELINFSGHPPDDPAPKKCLRTGVMTTDLEGKNIKIIETPTFKVN